MEILERAVKYGFHVGILQQKLKKKGERDREEGKKSKGRKEALAMMRIGRKKKVQKEGLLRGGDEMRFPDGS